jgi:predicted phage-related endonuclease
VVEGRIGEGLYAVVMTRCRYLESLDGQILLGDILFEHKMWNMELVAAVEARERSAKYWIQCEQQQYVSSAEHVIFVVSDGTAENMVRM